MPTPTRVAFTYDPANASDRLTLSVTTRGTLPVKLKEIDPTTGNEKDLGNEGPGKWSVTLAPGVYGFATDNGFDYTNPAPRYLTVALAQGKDPWPPPPPPPRAWSVAASTFYAWYATFLMSVGDSVGRGHVISVEPLQVETTKGR
jgi:hypothetical protein